MNHRASNSRWIIGGVTAAAAAWTTLTLPAANGAEPAGKQTPLDRAVLAQYDREMGVSGSAPKILNGE
ncbi:hypothetical protein AB0N17_44880 [Streptomyces sp. NPDC051133]|uniref:hypothetical protein n=1 Tax=Streptomyces sp. NPDC051133 TaxID=3155521 RepID=UPI0034328933